MDTRTTGQRPLFLPFDIYQVRKRVVAIQLIIPGIEPLIIVFGSIALDIVQSVPRLPRPGETMLTADYVMLPGGKGANQALAAARAGGDVSFVASIGDDDFGRRALTNLDLAGIDLSGIIEHTRPTACATISVDSSGENQIVVSSGANLETTADQLEPKAGDFVLLQMEIPLAEVWRGIEFAKANGAKCILNAAPFQAIPPEFLGQLDVLIVNEIEAQMLAGSLDLRGEELSSVCAQIRDRYDITVVLTLGANGALAFSNEERLQVNVLPVCAIDTVGAGDAFVGAFVAAMSRQFTLDECMAWGTVAGGLACTKPGAQDGIPETASIRTRLDEIHVSQMG